MTKLIYNKSSHPELSKYVKKSIMELVLWRLLKHTKNNLKSPIRQLLFRYEDVQLSL